MRIIFVTILVNFSCVGTILSQTTFDLCPQHYFKTVDQDLRDILENDFAVNGRRYPSIVHTDLKSITITNPFVDDEDMFEIFNRDDKTSFISSKMEVSLRALLNQLNLPYDTTTVLKQLNFFGQYCYFLYLNDSGSCSLIQFDSNKKRFNLLSRFKNTLDVADFRNNIKILFGSSDKIVISNEINGENVVLDLSNSSEVNYSRNPKGLFTIGILKDSIIIVNKQTYDVFKLCYLSPPNKNVSPLLKLPWIDNNPSFFFDYVDSKILVYFFDFTKFCLNIKEYSIK